MLKNLLKLVWFFGVLFSVGAAWMFCTMLILGQQLTFIHDYEDLFMAALLLPAYVFVGSSHISWMFGVGWIE